MIFVLAVDFDFLKEWEKRLKSEARPDEYQPVKDLSVIRSRLLVHKLIAWKSQDGKSALVPAGWKRLHECIQVRVLVRELAVCRHI